MPEDASGVVAVPAVAPGDAIRAASASLWTRATQLLRAPSSAPSSSSSPSRLTLSWAGDAVVVSGVAHADVGRLQWYRQSLDDGLQLVASGTRAYHPTIDDWDCMIACQAALESAEAPSPAFAEIGRVPPNAVVMSMADSLLKGSSLILCDGRLVAFRDRSCLELSSDDDDIPQRVPITGETRVDLEPDSTVAIVDGRERVEFRSPMERDMFACALRTCAREKRHGNRDDSIDAMARRIRDLQQRLHVVARAQLSLQGAYEAGETRLAELTTERQKALQLIAEYQAALEGQERQETALADEIAQLRNGVRSIPVHETVRTDPGQKKAAVGQDKQGESCPVSNGNEADDAEGSTKHRETTGSDNEDLPAQVESLIALRDRLAADNASLRDRLGAVVRREKRVARQAKRISALQVENAERDEKIEVLRVDRDRLRDELLALEDVVQQRDHELATVKVRLADMEASTSSSGMVSTSAVDQRVPTCDAATETDRCQTSQVPVAPAVPVSPAIPRQRTVIVRRSSEAEQATRSALESQLALAMRSNEELTSSNNALRSRCESLAKDLERMIKAAVSTSSRARTGGPSIRRASSNFADENGVLQRMQALANALTETLSERDDEIRMLQAANAILQSEIDRRAL